MLTLYLESEPTCRPRKPCKINWVRSTPSAGDPETILTIAVPILSDHKAKRMERERATVWKHVLKHEKENKDRVKAIDSQFKEKVNASFAQYKDTELHIDDEIARYMHALAATLGAVQVKLREEGVLQNLSLMLYHNLRPARRTFCTTWRNDMMVLQVLDVTKLARLSMFLSTVSGE
jgi:hypothetical protein